MTEKDNYKERLKEVIEASWFTIEAGTYIYTSVKDVLHPEKHLAVIRDENELTVITAEENITTLGPHEANKEKWKLVNIRCGKPFYCVGFIASITSALAENGIDIVLLSSFSNDLVLVMENDLNKALEIILSLGFRHKN